MNPRILAAIAAFAAVVSLPSALAQTPSSRGRLDYVAPSCNRDGSGLQSLASEASCLIARVNARFGCPSAIRMCETAQNLSDALRGYVGTPFSADVMGRAGLARLYAALLEFTVFAENSTSLEAEDRTLLNPALQELRTEFTASVRTVTGDPIFTGATVASLLSTDAGLTPAQQSTLLSQLFSSIGVRWQMFRTNIDELASMDLQAQALIETLNAGIRAEAPLIIDPRSQLNRGAMRVSIVASSFIRFYAGLLSLPVCSDPVMAARQQQALRNTGFMVVLHMSALAVPSAVLDAYASAHAASVATH